MSSLRNGDVTAMCGIGDWITDLLQRDGAPVTTVVPDEGGIQWSECYCKGKESKNHELAKKFIQYIASAQGASEVINDGGLSSTKPNKKWVEITK